MKSSSSWPVLKRYDGARLARVAMPLGGIGTGTVSLGGRGDLRDWEIVNRPAKGFTPLTPGMGTQGTGPFFALYVNPQSGPAVARAAGGPISDIDVEGAWGSKAPSHGLPRFRNCTFAAAYPLAQVLLSDDDVPLAVRIEAFNPLVPADVDASSIPCAVLRFVLINPTDRAVQASVCGTVPNFIGADGSNSTINWAGLEECQMACKENANEFRKAGGASGVVMLSRRPDVTAEQYGSMAMAVTGGEVSYRTAWAQAGFGDSLLDFWDDFSSDGRLEERPRASAAMPMASLASLADVPPHGERSITFLLTWHFPNRRTWSPAPVANVIGGQSTATADPDIVGNHYTTKYADAWDVALRTIGQLEGLEARTVGFVQALAESDLPPVVKEAALFNLSTLRSQTCFRTADGHFFGWEGCFDRAGSCHGSCTHVWNYEQATAFLFGSLARDMRQTEFLRATDDRGCMSFRVNLPLPKAKDWKLAAADGQMGCIMKLYRDWQLSGDEEMLRSLWPHARRALEFCWVEGGWDADHDGVMEGCQHNTMDVEYFGPNPQMTGWYLGALRAAAQMARHVGDDAFATTCDDLFRRGSGWMDEHLFNGQYYEQEIRPPKSPQDIAPGLMVGMGGSRNLADPEFQLGAGCLVDQLVGQYMSHICGLGYLHDPRHVRTTLESILKHNSRREFFSHFNHMRSFVVGNESAILMATYPLGRRPKRPFIYCNEVMTGFEYTAAVGMIYEGMPQEGIEVIQAIRNRYDGAKRSPFDEAECGHHYARAMASWASILAVTGFHYSAVTGVMEFAATKQASTFFWSSGDAWGTFKQQPRGGKTALTLSLLGGRLMINRIAVQGAGSAQFEKPFNLEPGQCIHSVATANR